MKKQLICCIAVLIILVQASACSFANGSVSTPLKIAVKKYKAGNYTGCLQDCQSIVKNEPSNALAYYYIAMSYVQAGKQKEAIVNYDKVLSLKSNARLLEYAATGKRCLETPNQCVLDPASEDYSDIDKFLATPVTNVLSDTVKKDIENKSLNGIRNDINNGKEIDNYNLRKLNEFSDPKSKILGSKENILQAPSNTDEIAAALKVLKDAGINPYSQTQAQASDFDGMNENANYQNPQLTQLNMLMGGANQQNDNSAMINMLPFMIAQNKNGTGNYSPQLVQSVIMNSMIPDFNFNLDKDK
ncbi:MAG: hypothetical protein WCG95_09365 [bacterium]